MKNILYNRIYLFSFLFVLLISCQSLITEPEELPDIFIREDIIYISFSERTEIEVKYYTISHYQGGEVTDVESYDVKHGFPGPTGYKLKILTANKEFIFYAKLITYDPHGNISSINYEWL